MTGIRRVACVLAAVIAAAAAPDRAAAQMGGVRAGGGVQIESYQFTKADSVNLKSVSLLTIPLAARVQLMRRLALTVDGAYASGTVARPGGATETLAGLTDTQIELTMATPADRFRVSAVGVLPTGKAELTASELDVAGVVASDLLPFAISNWGAGGGIGANAAVALPLNETTTFGLSGGYVVAREFSPIAQNSFAYRPGNQLELHGAADHTIGSSAKASLQLTYMHFAHDQADGANLYQAGDRLQGLGSLAFASGANGTGIVYLGYLHRLEGQFTNVVSVVPAQELVYGGVALRHPVGRAVLVPELDVRLLGNQAGVEQGSTFSLGTGVELPLGSALLVPSARARLGSLTVRSGERSGFTGFELGLTVRSRTTP